MEDILTRGVANIIPGKNELETLLKSGKKLNIYLGIDPTATKIHLGHAVSLRILQKFADLDHNVTFLIGDFTALIGDTSDKDSERPQLTKQEIEENFATYKSQAEKIVDFSKVNIKHNSEWLSKISFEELLKISNTFSLNDFISRELIKKRLTEGGRVGLSETYYPLMQAYDSYTLKTDVQIGGTDQTFNMQAGRNLIKTLDHRESFVLSTEFLMGTDGRKMSKSWGNAIWLDEEPFEMFRKVMSINDDQISNYFKLGTNILIDEIPNDQKISENPMEIKKKLAKIIVTEFHSENDAIKAGEQFEKVVQNKELPSSDMESLEVDSSSSIVDVLENLNLSKSEAKRLVEQDGVSLNDKKITDPNSKIESGVLKVGRHGFRKIVVK